MKKYSTILLSIIVFFSCNSKKEVNVTTPQNNNRIWMLVAFKDYEKDYFVKKNCFLDLTDKERASAKMGCNNLSFNYKIDGAKITFANGISTRMACQDMKLEYEFSKDILEIKSFSIKGHQLTLISETGQNMIFVAQDWD
jgi:heat shock protein HslJ